ncbi:DUF3331 domain-containing protein [Paraburkholderia sp. UYCP14C]|uniref:DUF3331 domain-containing protein n=1 Tax=Paraburkholderia sp. UYCP14C TaxID=2511130 RepID=UPI00102183DC|nr:DUF3331 domain-containing protein [Paraburkholderia sp. UYCP14C]RZF25781.1 DUF3331 domain-containing protein [Paraburkholderia sp. UYCP14C]
MNTDEGLRTQSRNRGANAGAEAGDKHASRRDPWEQTLLLLAGLCATEPHAQGLRPAELAPGPRIAEARCDDGRCRKSRNLREGRDATADAPCAAVVTLLEHLSPRTVALRWCSASCHYGYQIWVCSKARRAGVCAVSGRAIRRGDIIYRPNTRTPVLPVNVNAMIHLAALPDGSSVV